VPTQAHKDASVEVLKKLLGEAQLAVVADYRGLSVAELTDLRRRVQKVGGDVTVAKNTLVKVAMKDNDQMKDLASFLQGPTALVIGRDDFLGAAKALNDFSKEKRAVVVKIRGGVLHGEAVDTAKVVQLASLPSREALLTMVAQLLQSPIAGFARAVNALATQRSDGTETASAAPEAEAPAAEAPAAEAAEAPAAEAPAAAEESAPAEASSPEEGSAPEEGNA
jgi:large subunit ribosomal protein L10